MLSRRFLSLIIITTALKVALILWTPYSGDFSNWVRGAGYSFLLFSKAQLPTPNAYAGLEAILAPFYWLWTVLPIPHPALNEMVGQYSTAELALVFVMKIPALAFDLFAGFLLYELVRDRTGVERKGWIAFLVWYLNPYNIYWMYYYGGFDVIPTAILLLAVVYGNGGKWIQSGLCASLAAILRLFPFALFPFFVVYAAKQGLRPAGRMLSGLLSPLGIVFLSVAHALGSPSAVLPVLARIPVFQPWLEDFWGFPLDYANVFFKLTPFLLTIQLYFFIRYWRGDGALLEDITIACLLIMLVSQPQGNGYHFIWVSPLLSAYYALGRIKWRLLTSVYLAGALIPNLIPYDPHRLLSLLIEPFSGGLFFGLKAIVLTKVNMQMTRIGPNIQLMPHISSSIPAFKKPERSWFKSVDTSPARGAS